MFYIASKSSIASPPRKLHALNLKHYVLLTTAAVAVPSEFDGSEPHFSQDGGGRILAGILIYGPRRCPILISGTWLVFPRITLEYLARYSTVNHTAPLAPWTR